MNQFLSILTCFYQKVICVSRATRNNYLLRTGISEDKLIVIPNAIKTKSKSETKNKSEMVDNHKLSIIFVGRLSYRRGVGLLVDILPDFVKRYK